MLFSVRRRIRFTTLFGIFVLMLSLGISGTALGQLRGMMMATGGDDNEMLRRVQAVRSLGATCIRYPIYLGWQPDLNRWIAQIKHIQPFINSQGMTIIVDIHQANRGEPGFIGIRDQLQFERDWVQIASALGNRSNVWLDLLNEPAMPMSVWRPIAQRTAQSIRRVNQASTIVFACPGADVSTHINSLRPLDGIANQALTLHFWNWAGGSSLTGDVQSVYQSIPYPSANRGRTKERMDQLLDGVAGLRSRYGVPVLIGEVGISATHPNAPRFLRDFTSSARQRRIHVCLHAFREADVWNYERNPAAWSVVTAWLRN